MLITNSAIFQSALEENFEGRLFTRRADLSNEIRLLIGTNALHAMMNMNHAWGTVSRLANEYHVSRMFIYTLANSLKAAGQFIFQETQPGVSDSFLRKQSLETMLSLRLEGGSSLSAISTIMNRQKLKLSSTGSISQILSRIGALLPMTVSTNGDFIQYVVYCSDELFAKQLPILITVDPCSSAILRIELADSRKADDWKKHFECISDNGTEAIYLVSDDGKGIRAAHAEVLTEVARQSDTYHAIAHRLGSWTYRLEKSAYKAIAKEHDCEQQFNQAKSESVQNKRLAACIKATADAEKAIALYDDFSYLYSSVVGELNVFDADGLLRNSQQAEAGIKAGLELIKALNHANITDAVDKVSRALPDLFHYFDIAKNAVEECKKLGLDEESVKAYCIAWQWGKAARKAKNSERKKMALEREQFSREIALGLHQQESGDEEKDDAMDLKIQREVYSRLDKIVQSSAMVECINSIIRPYLNTCKNQISQPQLNLIMHYHNHRRYRDGVRKNKTPMEILTGKEQTKDWLALLFDIVREKKPELLLVS